MGMSKKIQNGEKNKKDKKGGETEEQNDQLQQNGKITEGEEQKKYKKGGEAKEQNDQLQKNGKITEGEEDEKQTDQSQQNAMLTNTGTAIGTYQPEYQQAQQQPPKPDKSSAQTPFALCSLAILLFVT